MQPVQYRGYAQGTAFNPLILSDQSRKILEQNEQFLRGLQEKQKIERNFEVAKLKQLQENIESQRQQLNENYGYDQRQRDRYNKSLQENAAREVQDLKRIAALDAKKPTTAAVVNDIADFLVGVSSTAAEVIGKVKEAKAASDQAAADFILNDGKLTNAFIGAQIGGKLVYDTATNTIISTFATAEAFKESGFELQEGQKLIDISSGVKQLVKFNVAKNKFKTFQLDFEGQEEYEFNGEKLTRGQFIQLSAADKKAVFEQQYDSALKELQEQTNFSPYMLQQLNTQKGNDVSKYYGQATKIQNKMLVGQTVELSKLKAQSDQTPDALEEYMAVVSYSKGGDRSAGRAAGVELLSDTKLFDDDAISALKKASLSDQTTPGGVLISRWSDIWQDTDKNRAASHLAAERQYDVNHELAEQRKLRALREYLASDKEDGRIDDTHHQELAQIVKESRANGDYKVARFANDNIQLTASFQKLEENREELEILYSNGNLDESHVLSSGLVGKEKREWLEKARETRAVTAPTPENKKLANSELASLLKTRITGGAGYEGQLPQKYYTALEGAKREYDAVYRNVMRGGGTHAQAHKEAMGVFMGKYGTDPTQGLYRVQHTYEQMAKQVRETGRIGDFLDDSFGYTPIDKPENNITLIRERVEKLGADALKTLTTKQQLESAFDIGQETGRYPKITQLEQASKILGWSYVDTYNYTAREHGNESKQIPDEITEKVNQIESIVRNSPLRKFLRARANLDPTVTTGLVLTPLSGQTWNQPQTMSAAAADFEKMFNAIGKRESSNNPSEVNDDSGASGKWQIMEDNIPKWSKEILGREVTTEEFMANPEIQRKIARAKLLQYYNGYIQRGESPDNAILKTAASWYAGENWEEKYGPEFLYSKHDQKYGEGTYASMYDYTNDILDLVRAK